MTKSKKERIKARDNYMCRKCKSREQLTIDHIVPVDLGGTDDDDNLQTLCKGCNIMKTNKPPKHRSFLNWLFSHKTFYEFKNETRSIVASHSGASRAYADRLRVDLMNENAKLRQEILDLKNLHGSHLKAIAERIHGLESHLKIEWVKELVGGDWLEKPIELSQYRKIKKVKK